MTPQRITPGADGQVHFMITSGFGGNTRSPFVQVEVNGSVTQMLPADARRLGMSFLEAAEAAEADGGMVAFCESLNFDQRETAALLNAFRMFRQQQHDRTAHTAWNDHTYTDGHMHATPAKERH